MEIQRRKLLSSFVWLAVLACTFCVGLNPGALAESQQLTVRVMTRNMDAGTDLNYLVGAATDQEFVQGLLATIAEVDASKPLARAAQLAVEIGEAKPELVALQEATIWSIEQGGQARVYDQLALLQAALDANGQHYRIAVRQTLADVPVSIPGLVSIRFTDQNAILVRTDLPPGHLSILGTETHLFENFLTFDSPLGLAIPIPDGWLAVDVKIRGARFKFANTHLLGPLPGPFFEGTSATQVLQAGELLAGLGNTSLPVILAGDFNSDAEEPQQGPDHTPTAGIITRAGYQDAWHSLFPVDTGYTWPLFLEDQPPPNFNLPARPIERIDLIFSDGPTALSAVRTGTGPGPQGVFASDHVGVLVNFSLENHRPVVPHGSK